MSRSSADCLRSRTITFRRQNVHLEDWKCTVLGDEPRRSLLELVQVHSILPGLLDNLWRFSTPPSSAFRHRSLRFVVPSEELLIRMTGSCRWLGDSRPPLWSRQGVTCSLAGEDDGLMPGKVAGVFPIGFLPRSRDRVAGMVDLFISMI